MSLTLTWLVCTLLSVPQCQPTPAQVSSSADKNSRSCARGITSCGLSREWSFRVCIARSEYVVTAGIKISMDIDHLTFSSLFSPS